MSKYVCIMYWQGQYACICSQPMVKKVNDHSYDIIGKLDRESTMNKLVYWNE